MSTVLDYINLNDLSKLNLYRERLHDFVRSDGYKGDCGEIEIGLPGVSNSLWEHGAEFNQLTLHVRCYGATDNGRSHYFNGKTLGDAVDEAEKALRRWERGEYVDE